mmetsp:Transcript_10226/g.23936  ORF Transcript_10226/g.23936 Transcript_10226/m.23936 type:complete len:486 (+) Transcript_10226:2293-3750(+)
MLATHSQPPSHFFQHMPNRYCKEGLKPGHHHLLELFVQRGAGISPSELLAAQLLDGSPAFEEKHRRFVQDRLTKCTQRAQNPNSRWTAPVADRELLYSTFKNTGIVKTLIERSDMSEDLRRTPAPRVTRGGRSAPQAAPSAGTMVQRGSSRNVDFDRGDDDSADLSFSGTKSSMNHLSDDNALHQTFKNLRFTEDKPPSILRAPRQLKTSAISDFMERTGARQLTSGLSRWDNPCMLLANVAQGDLLPDGSGNRVRKLMLSLLVDSPEDLDLVDLELDLETEGLNSKHPHGFCGAILTVPIVFCRELERQTLCVTKTVISQEEEIISDRGLSRTADQDEVEAVERLYDPEARMTIDQYRHIHAASIDGEGNPKTKQIRLLFPIDPESKSKCPLSGHNQFWNGDTLMSTDPPNELNTLQGRPEVDTENSPAKSEKFDIEVRVSNRTEMRWYIPLLGGESQVYKKRASKSPVKADASRVTRRLARYG